MFSLCQFFFHVWVFISGPVDYKPGEALGAPDHPHRGFETVTYVIDGGVRHQDSAGNKGKMGMHVVNGLKWAHS